MVEISIICTIYNSEKYLNSFFKTILQQSFENFELICVNDGSKDNSLKIINEYMSKDKRIILIDKENTGAGDSRNIGLLKSTGKYVIFLDSDDFFSKNMLLSMYKNAEKYNSDIVLMNSNTYLKGLYFSNNNINDLNYLLKNKTNIKKDKNELLCCCNGWAWDKLFKREFIINNGILFQKIRSSNDLYFTYSNMLLAKTITYVNKVGVHQRKDVKNSLTATNHKSWDCCLKALSELHKFIVNNGLLDTYKKSYQSFAVKFLSWNLYKYPLDEKKKLFDSIINNLKILNLDNINPDDINYNEKRYFESFTYIYSNNFDSYIKIEKNIKQRIKIKNYLKKILYLK